MIRPTRPGDEPAVLALQSLLYRADERLVPAACTGPLLGRLAVADGVVGYAIAVPGDVPVLAELAVAPAARRQGHGRALVESVAAALETEELSVTTRVGDDRAIEFYRALGFEIEARRPDFYGDADGLRLRRRA